MDIAYTAHTETCTLLLDAEGICRSVLAVSSRVAANGGARPTRIPTSAERCVGAQYVATLDLREPGGMAPLPTPGAQMLFARTEANGRITLIRSAPVVRFAPAKPTAKAESGVHERPEDVTPVMPVKTPAKGVKAAKKPVSYGDDDELTIPCEPPTLVNARRSSLPPPPAPVRNSGVVPAGTVARQATIRPSSMIPPPPRAPRVEPAPESITRPTYAATAPFNVPVKRAVPRPSASDIDVETRPFKRAKR
jgi:hypothetical protein